MEAEGTLEVVLATAGNGENSHAVGFRKKVWEQEEINSIQLTFVCHALC